MLSLRFVKSLRVETTAAVKSLKMMISPKPCTQRRALLVKISQICNDNCKSTKITLKMSTLKSPKKFVCLNTLPNGAICKCVTR